MTTTEHPELEPQFDPQLEPQPDEPSRRRFPIWLGIIVLIGLLAGAAYVGARLVNASPGATAGGPQFAFDGNGGQGIVEKRMVEIDPAPELPARSPDKTGMVTEVKDRSLMVSEGGSFKISVDDGGAAGGGAVTSSNSEATGPSTEVVVTGETKIYRDTTFDERMPGENEKIQQVVEPFEFSQVNKDSFVSVWGYKRGDRLIAEVILYSQPVIFNAGDEGE